MYKNETVKREYFEHLKGAKGFADESVTKYAEAIAQWQTFTNNEDFNTFDKSKALEFREWLKTRDTHTKSGTLSLSTQYKYLRFVKNFFLWLSDQKEYRAKIAKSDVEFLRLSNNDARIARAGNAKTIPTTEEVKQIIEHIEVHNEIDMRDRALLSFALITGCRISAICSLKIRHFDKAKLLVYQNPGQGVKTKNSKTILTTFFPIGWNEPERYFLEWYEYLVTKKHFSGDDPLFPATEREFGLAKTIYSKDTVTNKFWSGTDSARKIFAKRCHNAGLPYFHPHLFRHFVVSVLSKTRLTEEEKRAISRNLGHENVGTTFGSYGYGAMTDERATEIVQELKKSLSASAGTRGPIDDNDLDALEQILLKARKRRYKGPPEAI